MNQTTKKIYNCITCKKENNWTHQKINKYCDNYCMNEHRYLQYIERWKNNLEQGQKGASQTSSHIRRYIVEKFNNRCQCCGAGSEWNNKPITLQLEHLDGNSRNNTETNLSLLCPNCHTQTEFYGSRNNGRGRGSLLKENLA